jgi:hypothetical protein
MRNSSSLNTLDKWTKACTRKQRVWQKSEINAVIKALQRINFSDSLNSNEFQFKHADLLAACHYQEGNESGPFEHSITKEQSDYGLEYLKRRYFKLNGTARRQCPFNLRQQAIIMHAFKEFKFVGFYEHRNDSGMYVGYTPVYRVHANNGEYFDYSPIHWGNPLVFNY